MTPEDKERLEMLRDGPNATLRYIKDYYGLDWPLSKNSQAAFYSYQRTPNNRSKSLKGRISRYEIEGFMALNDLFPKKWAAARMGMAAESLDAVLDNIGKIGMLRSRYEIGTEFIAESLQDDLVRHLSGIRFLVFSDHTDFCQSLHADIRKILRVKVTPLFCSTSDRLQEYPRRFAAHFDCITLQPLSTNHSLWLNFHKPLNLPPDRCSKLFYAENMDSLKPDLLSPGEGDSKNLLKYCQSRVSA